MILLNKLLVFECFQQDLNGSRVGGEIAFVTAKRYNEEEVRGGRVALWEDFEMRAFLPLA